MFQSITEKNSFTCATVPGIVSKILRNTRLKNVLESMDDTLYINSTVS